MFNAHFGVGKKTSGYRMPIFGGGMATDYHMAAGFLVKQKHIMWRALTNKKADFLQGVLQ